MTKRSFGELELEILHTLKSGERLTVKDVHQILGEQNKYNTIMTVMTRLAAKGLLGREKLGLQYEYWLLSTKAKVPSFIEQIKTKLFGIKTMTMVSYLIESADDISEEEFLEIENLLEKAKASRKNKGS